MSKQFEHTPSGRGTALRLLYKKQMLNFDGQEALRVEVEHLDGTSPGPTLKWNLVTLVSS
jgi:hypothetical protein